MKASFPTCLLWGERIALDEPVVVREHDRERQAVPAREPSLIRGPSALLVHVQCAHARVARVS
jgi:hypothetical protein